MRLAQIRRSNRAKLARLEARGYIFDEEYKKYVANAKGKLATKNIRARADIIFDRKKGDLYIRDIDYSDVQLEKAKTEMYKYFNALRGGDTEKAKNILSFVLSGEISSKKPFRLSGEQAEQYSFRIKDTGSFQNIPKYGTQEYWYWRDFQRNNSTFYDRLVAHGVSPEIAKKMENDEGIMYRFNHSEGFIEKFFDSLFSELSENDIHFLLDDIIGSDWIEKNLGEDGYDTLLQALF